MEKNSIQVINDFLNENVLYDSDIKFSDYYDFDSNTKECKHSSLKKELDQLKTAIIGINNNFKKSMELINNYFKEMHSQELKGGYGKPHYIDVLSNNNLNDGKIKNLSMTVLEKNFCELKNELDKTNQLVQQSNDKINEIKGGHEVDKVEDKLFELKNELNKTNQIIEKLGNEIVSDRAFFDKFQREINEIKNFIKKSYDSANICVYKPEEEEFLDFDRFNNLKEENQRRIISKLP